MAAVQPLPSLVQVAFEPAGADVRPAALPAVDEKVKNFILIMLCMYSLRARYGTNSIRNAVHGSSSQQLAIREISFFFPTLVRDSLPDEASSKKYFDKHLKGVLLKGLTALAKAKPHSDPLHVITWLATWLQENNSNKPLVDGARLVVGLH
ncbi:hypothetical protein L7F22_046386 [Adiantum nelumboides]|nr:hypothetical protein [Adiantum nelumboides]